MRSVGMEVAGSVWAPPPPSPTADGAPAHSSSSPGSGTLATSAIPAAPLPDLGATRSGSPVPLLAAPRVADGAPVASAMARTVLDALQDHEEGFERRLALAQAAEQQAAHVRAVPPPASRTRAQRRQREGRGTTSGVASDGGFEPAFEFAPVPTDAALAANTDTFESRFMHKITSHWPQTMATFKRRRLNDEGEDCPGAAEGSLSGTNATVKTWATRIRVACAFADFVARTVCWHPGDECPSDEERDRGVKKFFRCMSPVTLRVILSFLRSRKRGQAVAGGGREAGVGGKPLTAVTLKDYTNGLTFLFAEAKLDGPHGVQTLVVDCSGRTSPWQAKGQAELDKEEEMRADPGTCIGNPMTTDELRNFRGATNKEARINGERSLSAAAVTPEVMRALHSELWARHAPAVPASVDVTEAAATPSAEATGQRHVYTPPSDADADQLTYIFYVMLFISIGRPVTVMDLKFEDVLFPDMKMAENQEFFNMYVVLCSCALFALVGWRAHDARHVLAIVSAI